MGDMAIGTIPANGTIGSAEITNGAVTATKIETQQAWQSMTATAGVSGSIWYMKDSLGFVHFRGDSYTNLAYTAAATVFTLPAGYRPVAQGQWLVSGVTFAFFITAVGVGFWNTSFGAGASVGFGPIVFKAEN